jgi:hypothetical protein
MGGLHNLQWWVSGSFAVILTSYFARESLKIPVAVLLGILYILFTTMLTLNSNLDGLKMDAVFHDSRNLAAITGCGELQLVQPLDVPVFGAVFSIFVTLMGIATLGYLAYSIWLNRKDGITRDSETN